jgi:NAD(P)-dependent dehydrogenase (short-subunit alcohol dehydrogenase family)
MTSSDGAKRFAGKVVLVTGAGQGIGRGIAQCFGAAGARVAVLDRNERGCRQVVGEIIDAGGAAFPIVANLADSTSRSEVIPSVLETTSGALDFLVNNAAIHGPRQPLANTSDAEIREVIEVNLIAPLFLCRDALPALSRRGGAIVLISSIQARLPLPTFVPYVATKNALDGVTRALAVETAGTGVRVNAVAPGAVESPAMREQWEASTGSAGIPPAPTLIGRWGTGRDIAQVVAFLCSPAAEFVSGEVIRVDGGRLLSRYPDPLGKH